jgi:glycerophosphoryl diester phosphodiesterase
MTSIITHRGLDPDKAKYFMESSKKAFKDQLKRGYGIEFDIRKTKDNKFIIIHDDNLSRFTKKKDSRKIKDVHIKDLLKLEIGGSHLIDLSNILDLIENMSKPNTISALHLKSEMQNTETLDLLIKELKHKDLSKLIIFDVLKDTAIYFKKYIPKIKLVPSVSHPYDIKRYNKTVGNTLWELKDVLKNKKLFYGVWLDEWDTLNKDKTKKTLYNKKIFDYCRSAKLKIFIVSPELHLTSPGLYGGEAHEDAKNEKTLINRITKIINLKPDHICTDHPDKVKDLL